MKNKKQILDYRKELEQEIINYLKKTKSHFILDDVKKIIYEEDDQNDLTEIIKMFDTGYGDIQLDTVLELVNDAWNYFPHKMIGGISPEEKVVEFYENNNK